MKTVPDRGITPLVTDLETIERRLREMLVQVDAVHLRLTTILARQRQQDRESGE